MAKKKGCLTAFGVVFLIIVVAVIIGSMSEDEKKPIPTKTETQTEQKTPSGSSDKYSTIINAEVKFDGTQFTITNNDYSDWTNVKFEINSGLLSSGYILREKRIRAQSAYTVGALQFAKPGGERFNPFTMKPQSMFIICDQGNWNGEWN